MNLTVVARICSRLKCMAAFLAVSLIIYILFGLTGVVNAAPNTELNFQARLLGGSGELIPDGDYHVEFKLYDAEVGGVNVWTETYTTGSLIRVENGYLTTQLGSLTAFPGSIDWSEELFLTLNVGGNAVTPTYDGEMTPRLKVTAVPYAFRAGELQGAAGGFTADELVQLAPSSIQTIAGAVDAIRINQTGSGGLISLQGDGADVFTVDKTGNTSIAAGLTLGNSTLANAGTIRWTGSDFEGFDGTSWVSLTSGTGGGGGGASAVSATFYDATGGATVGSGSFSVINLDSTLTNTDVSVLSVASDVVTVAEAGTYQVSYQVTSRLASGVRSGFNAKLQLDTGGGFSDVAGSESYHYGRVSSETQGTSTATVTLQLSPGDSIRVQGLGTSESFNTIANATSLTISRLSGGGGATDAFVQDGNGLGEEAVIGTVDNNGLRVITNNNTAITIDASGDTTIEGQLTVDSISSSLGSNLTLESTTGVIDIQAGTLQRVASGTTDINLQDASANTALNLFNGDASRVADLIVEGSVTATSFSGNGASITDINATNITSGTLADALLSTNIPRLDGTTNNFLNNVTFGGGLTVGNTALANAGNIRWTGADFEGFDGTSWVSLTGGGAASSSGDYISQTTTSNSNASGAIYNVFQSSNYGSFTSTENAANNITFNPVNGRFTAPTGGTYAISANLMLENSNNSLMNIVIRVNGTDVFNQDAFIHSAVDPVERSVTLVQELSDGDYVEVLVDGSTGNITAHGGTTLTIVPVSSSSGSGGGGGGSGISFEQNGNGFGATAILGTTDANGLNIITNGVNALTINSAGLATFTNELTVSDGITSSGDLNISSGGSGDLILTSASGTVKLEADTLQRTASGTTVLDLLDSSGPTIFSVLNSDTSEVANLLIEGSATASSFIGDGSSITNLNATNVSSGTLDDNRLSANVPLLDAEQTFSAEQTFGSGLVVGNSTSTETGAIRFNGTDFEGFNGTEWVSLNDSGADVINIVKTTDETLNNSVALQDDDELTFEVEANQTWTVDFVLQAQSGTTPDFRFAVSAPGGSTCQVGYENLENAQSNAQYGCGVSTNRVAGNNQNDVYRIVGTITTGATAGDVTLRWAQFTGNGVNTTVRAGSYLRAVQHNGTLTGGGGGGSSTSFEQNGNSFGATAILGTTDTNALRFVTNSIQALEISALGNALFSGAVTSGGLLSANAGFTVTSGVTDLDLNGLIDAGAISGVTTLDASGVITGGSFTTTGSITSATSGNTINGLIVNSGSLSGINGFSQTSGNFDISGTGTFTTGTGNIDLNGVVTVASTIDISDGVTVNGTNSNVDSRIYAEDSITIGSSITGATGSSETYTFDADDDADESAWTFVSDNGGNGLEAANTARSWSHDIDDTVSAGVGPTSGQGGSPDGYIYTEASSPAAAGDTFHATYNTVLDAATEDWVVEFYWNQRGDNNLATVEVQTNEAGGGWVTRGTYGTGGPDVASSLAQQWNFESLDLSALVSSASTQVRFFVTLGSTGNIWNNDFALDTITVRTAVVSPGTFTYGDNIIEGYNNNAVSDVDLLVLRSDVTSTDNVVFRVDSDGDVYSDGTNNIAGGADIAENYKNNDGAEPGDVVYFTNNSTVAKTTDEGQKALAGVVSTEAAIILDAGVEDAVPVGLKGRLPTKVSAANGPIKAGDYITSGPGGRAVKAVAAGPALGIAMEDSNTDGVIDVFVGLTHYTPPLELDLGSLIPGLRDSSQGLAEQYVYDEESGQQILVDTGVQQQQQTTSQLIETGFSALQWQIDALTLRSSAFSVAVDDERAVSVTSSLGLSVFNVDTVNGVVRIGSGDGQGMNVSFILDSFDEEPAGVNGAQYYNTALGRFRCYENNQWKNCINEGSAGSTSKILRFVDTTIDMPSNLANENYWDESVENNNSQPTITLTSENMVVTGGATLEVRSSSISDKELSVHIERSIGSQVECGLGTLIDSSFGVFMSSPGSRSTTLSFIDTPQTTDQVFYTICSDESLSDLNGLEISRLRIVLQEVEEAEL